MSKNGTHNRTSPFFNADTAAAAVVVFVTAAIDNGVCVWMNFFLSPLFTFQFDDIHFENDSIDW